MYKTPTSELPICVASRIRCDSPPESVVADRPSVKYVNPTFVRNPSRARISLSTWCAICSSRALGLNSAKNFSHCSIESRVSLSMFAPPTVTASASGFSRAPLHCGQTEADMYFSMSSFT